MKKILSIITAFVLSFSIVLPAFNYAYAEEIISTNEIGKEPKKVINIVYDDSGSMVNGSSSDVTDKAGYITTWAQAKYSLEVFVAMMNNEDLINIYCMSGAGKKSKTVKGSDKDGGVDDIHSNFKTGDYSVLTPIQTLESAYKDLNDKQYDEYEKWLVVLTDGSFTVSNTSGELVQDSNVKNMISSYGKNLDGNLIYIPIGSNANEYKGKSYHTQKASTGEEILNQIKKATEIIYDGRDGEVISDSVVNLGVSMRKIIVFAQGEGVEIESVSKGNITDNISVKYTEAENAVDFDETKTTFKGNEDKIKTDKSLQGVVVTIEPNGDCIEPGQLNVVFGEKIPKSYTIYFEPAVKAYYSLEKDGVEYLSSENKTDSGSLNPGTYKLTAYIADAFQKDGDIPRNVSDAEEIQKIGFDVNLSGSGVEGGQQRFSAEQLRNGVNIHLLRGDIQCNANASIIDGKYQVDTENMKNAFDGITVKDTYRLEVSYELPTASVLNYRFKKVNFLLGSLGKMKDKKDMIKAVVTCYDNDGNKVDITDEQWAIINSQNLKLYFDDKVIYDDNYYNFHTENGSGIFYLCPRYWQENDKQSKKKTTHTNYIHRKRLCSVRSEVYIDVSDSLAYSTLGSTQEQKSTVYEISISMWYTIISLIIFFWVLGCIIKPRFPRKRRVYIKNQNFKLGIDDYTGQNNVQQVRSDIDTSVKIKRKLWSLVIPVVAQRGKLDFGIPGPPTLKLKATWQQDQIKITNRSNDFSALNADTNLVENNKYFKIDSMFFTDKNTEDMEKDKSAGLFYSKNVIFEIGFGKKTRFKKYKAEFNENFEF